MSQEDRPLSISEFRALGPDQDGFVEIHIDELTALLDLADAANMLVTMNPEEDRGGLDMATTELLNNLERFTFEEPA